MFGPLDVGGDNARSSTTARRIPDDDEVFSTVSIDRVAGTISWPNGIDLDPDVFRGHEAAATVGQARLVRAYRLESAT